MFGSSTRGTNQPCPRLVPNRLFGAPAGPRIPQDMRLLLPVVPARGGTPARTGPWA
ncbi:hypothetical protein SAM23877_0307 [Streptomyces ambofaciens ATCC 23877]|uniref:Uncharacterized protein n=1 Tax=Streptomyces ambofaciens (strain ATCC 23877 / 3486 / DSM 40053 / JCM 4204 / NBRC 12836 / NRRL B-2516) TaxID=278992 RepID=A0A0K2AKB3_STRA7|nr:hypothetical protein SAM23877_0307 [Streptomyces ambofaciens ATCC 23877]